MEFDPKSDLVLRLVYRHFNIFPFTFQLLQVVYEMLLLDLVTHLETLFHGISLQPGPMNGLLPPASLLPYKSTVFYTNFVSAVAPR